MEDRIINKEFLDNIEFLLMCKNIITGNHKIGGCLVRQQGFITASLESYLDFWFNCLPLSADSECHPICAVSEEECFIRTKDGELVKAELNAPVKQVVAAFKECKKRNKAAHDNPTLKETISALGLMIAHDEIERTDLIGWQQYYLPARVSVLETRNKILEDENLYLKTLVADSESALLEELPKYSDIFKDKELRFNNNLIKCEWNIHIYKGFLFRHRNDYIYDRDAMFLRKITKDALRYQEMRRKQMLKITFPEIPEIITDMSVSKINKICGTELKDIFKV